MKNGNLVSLAHFRKRKAEEETLSRGRKPLYVSHARGRVAGSKESSSGLSDFSDRIAEIRAGLNKINQLMADLEKLPSQKAVR